MEMQFGLAYVINMRWDKLIQNLHCCPRERINNTVKFSFSSISGLTLSFVNGIMGRKEAHYSLGPEHMLDCCAQTHTNTHTGAHKQILYMQYKQDNTVYRHIHRLR